MKKKTNSTKKTNAKKKKSFPLFNISSSYVENIIFFFSLDAAIVDTITPLYMIIYYIIYNKYAYLFGVEKNYSFYAYGAQFKEN